MGATQNSQSWLTAQSPTNSATPVLRAGFTEVLVTGMLMRWIRVRHRPMAIGAKPAGARLSVGAHEITVLLFHLQIDRRRIAALIAEGFCDQGGLAEMAIAFADQQRDIALGGPAIDQIVK